MARLFCQGNLVLELYSIKVDTSPWVVGTVSVKGRIVAGDAMFVRKSVCREALAGGGEYLVMVKENQSSLREAIDNALEFIGFIGASRNCFAW
jgi:predicted transposase YbfD/YdcC